MIVRTIVAEHRINFLKPERDIIAQRAGYRCSFPGCNVLTVGPGLADDQVENTGTAAHIHSASKGGPRGHGTLTEDQLRAPTNGIWMCGRHSDLIDKNSGVRYSVTTLQSWKALHESRIAYEHSGRQAMFGFVRRLTIEQSPIFKRDTIVDLAKATILVGCNGAGKTAICEWFSSVSSPRRLARWKKITSDLKYTISFDAPIERHLSVSIPEQVPYIKLDGIGVSANPIPVSVAYLESCKREHGKDDLCLFEKALSIDPMEVQSLADFIDTQSIFLNGAKWERYKDDDGNRITNLTCVLKNNNSRNFGLLSGSEQGRVLLDFAIAKAVSSSKFIPTLLVVEVQSLGIDWEKFAPYMSLFVRSSSTFQTLITTYELPAEIEQLGWQVYRIDTLGDSHTIFDSTVFQ